MAAAPITRTARNLGGAHMRLLILGGTQFLGRAIGRHACAAGHDVTCAARGTSGTIADGARLIRGAAARFLTDKQRAAHVFRQGRQHHQRRMALRQLGQQSSEFLRALADLLLELGAFVPHGSSAC